MDIIGSKPLSKHWSLQDTRYDQTKRDYFMRFVVCIFNVLRKERLVTILYKAGWTELSLFHMRRKGVGFYDLIWGRNEWMSIFYMTMTLKELPKWAHECINKITWEKRVFELWTDGIKSDLISNACSWWVLLWVCNEHYKGPHVVLCAVFLSNLSLCYSCWTDAWEIHIQK